MRARFLLLLSRDGVLPTNDCPTESDKFPHLTARLVQESRPAGRILRICGIYLTAVTRKTYDQIRNSLQYGQYRRPSRKALFSMGHADARSVSTCKKTALLGNAYTFTEKRVIMLRHRSIARLWEGIVLRKARIQQLPRSQSPQILKRTVPCQRGMLNAVQIDPPRHLHSRHVLPIVPFTKNRQDCTFSKNPGCQIESQLASVLKADPSRSHGELRQAMEKKGAVFCEIFCQLRLLKYPCHALGLFIWSKMLHRFSQESMARIYLDTGSPSPSCTSSTSFETHV